MVKKHKYPKQFWWSIGVFSSICMVIFVIPAILTQCGSILDFTETGQIGDTIGGIMGPFVAIGAAFLTFMAFWVQKEANDAQRRDIKVERFNSNFYSLLTIHEQITDALVYSVPRTSITYKGRDVFYQTFENEIEYHGWKGVKEPGMKGALKVYGIKAYEASRVPTNFDHYFRNMYRILKYVDETDVFDDLPEKERKKKKYEYVAILRSTLSRYELVWLFYNSLSVYGNDKFKPLIERYAMLKNIRPELLIDLEHVLKYEKEAFGDKYPIEVKSE